MAAQPWHSVTGCLHVVLTCVLLLLEPGRHLPLEWSDCAAAVNTTCVRPRLCFLCLCFSGLVWRFAAGAHHTSTQGIIHALMILGLGGRPPANLLCIWLRQVHWQASCELCLHKPEGRLNPWVGGCCGRTEPLRSAALAGGRTFPLHVLPCCMLLLLSCVFWWRPFRVLSCLRVCCLRSKECQWIRLVAHASLSHMSPAPCTLSHCMQRPQLISWAIIYWL